MMRWIVILGMVATILALATLGSTGELHLHSGVAGRGGVFLSVLLGCGLFLGRFWFGGSGLGAEVGVARRRG